VVAAAETTVEVGANELVELEELKELDEIAALVLIVADPAATAYKVTTLQLEPRLYWNLGVKTARIPLQSTNWSAFGSNRQRNWRVIPEAIAAPRTESASTHWLLTETV
jgi:hypothetical protein